VSEVLVPDDVWSRLDPAAARLSRRDRRRVAFAVAVALVLVGLTGVGSAAGFFRPKLETTHRADTVLRPDRHEIDVMAEVANNGLIDERITAVGSTDPNLRVRVEGLPMTIRAHHHATLAVNVVVQDCTHVRNAAVTIRITVDRLWWHLSRDVRLLDVPDPDGRSNAVAVCH